MRKTRTEFAELVALAGSAGVPCKKYRIYKKMISDMRDAGYDIDTIKRGRKYYYIASSFTKGVPFYTKKAPQAWATVTAIQTTPESTKTVEAAPKVNGFLSFIIFMLTGLGAIFLILAVAYLVAPKIFRVAQ